MKTFGEVIKDWMVTYKLNSVKPATYDRLETSFGLMSKYSVFYYTIDALSSDVIQEYVNALVDDGYSLSTVKKQFHLISAFMTHANLKGIIVEPLHKGVKLPS